MVGLFIPGKSLTIASSLSFGAFNKTYLLFFAFFTAFILNNNLSSKLCFSADRFLLLINTASDLKIVSSSLNFWRYFYRAADLLDSGIYIFFSEII